MAPISISLDGASEAVEFVKDLIVPWRRAHTEKLASLELMQKQVEIEQKKAEILEQRAQQAVRPTELEKLQTEMAMQRAEAEKIKIENEKLKLELQQKKIELALLVLEKMATNLSEAEKISYINRILPLLDPLVANDLQIESVTSSPNPKTG